MIGARPLRNAGARPLMGAMSGPHAPPTEEEFMHSYFFVLLGLVAGVLSGIFGLGGATILIPALVFMAGFTQHQAQGTTLAVMIPPIGLLAALRYYYAGHVKVGVAAFICLGFFFGGLLGASLVQNVPESILKRAFGVFLMLISLKMIIGK